MVVLVQKGLLCSSWEHEAFEVLNKTVQESVDTVW